jgi:hypothetical protein
MKPAPKKDVAQEGTKPEPAKIPDPENRQTNSELLAPLVKDLEKILCTQSKLNNYQAALAERKNQKETQLAALDDKIANLARKYTGSETDVLIQLSALRSAKEEIPKLIDGLTPVPVLDLVAIGEELRLATKRLYDGEEVLLLRIYDYYHKEARNKLAQTYGEDESSDPSGLDRDAIARLSPACGRISALLDKLPTTFFGVVDPAANYASTYQRWLDEIRAELELVNPAELPPARVVFEPDRTIRPVISVRGSKRELPRELAPTGWRWGEESNAKGA